MSVFWGKKGVAKRFAWGEKKGGVSCQLGKIKKEKGEGYKEERGLSWGGFWFLRRREGIFSDKKKTKEKKKEKKEKEEKKGF